MRHPMNKSYMNPNTGMDFYSEVNGPNYFGYPMRTSNLIPNSLSVRNSPYQNQEQDFNEFDNRNNYRTIKAGNSVYMGQKSTKNLRNIKKKNSTMSMHNLNNFGYLKESGNIQPQDTNFR